MPEIAAFLPSAGLQQGTGVGGRHLGIVGQGARQQIRTQAMVPARHAGAGRRWSHRRRDVNIPAIGRDSDRRSGLSCAAGLKRVGADGGVVSKVRCSPLFAAA